VHEYVKGETKPSRTVAKFGPGAFPEGLALDSSGNLYVAYNDHHGQVLEFSNGSRKGRNLGIHVAYVGGMTIDRSDNIVLVDQNHQTVYVFPQGATTPSHEYKPSSLTDEVALDKDNGELYVTNPTQPPSVNVLSYPTGTIVNTITATLVSVEGVATSPEGSP
jgi:sugar lactone lactonase YvrE